MPDFAMCLAVNCPSSARCKRHADSGTVPNVPMQSYASFHPIFQTGQCESFILVGKLNLNDEKLHLNMGETK